MALRAPRGRQLDTVIVPRPRVTYTEYDVSQRKEWAALKARGFPGKPHEHPELWARYRCIDTVCMTHRASPTVLRVLPTWRQGAVVCPGCMGPLEQIDVAATSVEFKLELEGRVIHRFSVVEGQPAVLGRRTLPTTPQIGALGDAGRLAQLSRDHLRFELDDDTVTVQDLDSASGTQVSRWQGRRRAFGGRPQSLSPKHPARLGPRDVLEIGSRIRVRRSGRSIAEADALSAVPRMTGAWRGDPTAPVPRAT